MPKDLKNGKDEYGIIRPGAKLEEIFNRSLIQLFLIGTLVGVVMSALIF